MTSYRTVLFSAVAFVAAAAPAVADSVPAVFKATAARPPIVAPADSVPAVFKSATAPSRVVVPMDSVPAVFKSSSTSRPVVPMDSVPAVFKSSSVSRPVVPMDSVPAVFKSTAKAPVNTDASFSVDAADATGGMTMDDLFRFMFGNYLPLP